MGLGGKEELGGGAGGREKLLSNLTLQRLFKEGLAWIASWYLKISCVSMTLAWSTLSAVENQEEEQVEEIKRQE